MYFPYFRGKQNELLVIRENAELLASSNFTPIVEPVNNPDGSLIRCIEAVVEVSGSIILIINTKKSVKKEQQANIQKLISDYLQTDIGRNDSVKIGLLLTTDETTEFVLEQVQTYADRELFLIHNGFNASKSLSAEIPSANKSRINHVFLNGYGGKLYQKRFDFGNQILIRDGFINRPNREHREYEFFSDLHVTYEMEHMNGFGDFTITGDFWTDGGGPAYTVAIHITCIDPGEDNQMFIHHFKSHSSPDEPTDPAGKFAEALQKLVDEASKPDTLITQTEAIKEFVSLNERKHYPGLGYIKKLSMQHHIETFSTFCAR